MRRAALLVFLAGLVLVASACGERAEPTGQTVQLFPVTVRGITLQHAPARVAAIGSPAVSVVKALLPGAEPGVQKPRLLAEPSVDAGRLRAFRPDIVIDSSGQSAAELQRLARAPVYTFSPSSIRDTEEGILDTGALVGDPLQARRINEDIEHKRTEVQREVGNLPPTSVFLDTGFFITVPAHSLAGDILSEAGGKSVAGANPGAGPYDLERLRRDNPDFYLATSDSGITLKDLRKNARTKDLRAVRAGNFGIVQSSSLQPGPEIGAGLVAVAKLLHPDAVR